MSLCLIFTRGVSLKLWHEKGLLEREASLFNELHERTGRPVIWLTYGCEDPKLAPKLVDKGILSKNIKVVSRPSWCPILFFSFFAFFIKYHSLKDIETFYSNQVDGAWALFFTAFSGKKYRFSYGLYSIKTVKLSA